MFSKNTEKETMTRELVTLRKRAEDAEARLTRLLDIADQYEETGMTSTSLSGLILVGAAHDIRTAINNDV